MKNIYGVPLEIYGVSAKARIYGVSIRVSYGVVLIYGVSTKKILVSIYGVPVDGVDLRSDYKG